MHLVGGNRIRENLRVVVKSFVLDLFLDGDMRQMTFMQSTLPDFSNSSPPPKLLGNIKQKAAQTFQEYEGGMDTLHKHVIFDIIYAAHN